MRTRGWIAVAVAAAAVAAIVAVIVQSRGPGPQGAASGTTGSSRVLLVGTFHGHHGQYRTIQTAVDAAKPGDWVLVAPGDYHPGTTTGHR